MYEGILVDVAFAGFFLAKVCPRSCLHRAARAHAVATSPSTCAALLTRPFQWLGKQSFLDDLASLDPDLYNGLIFLKHYNGNFEDLALNFTVALDGPYLSHSTRHCVL